MHLSSDRNNLIEGKKSFFFFKMLFSRRSRYVPSALVVLANYLALGVEGLAWMPIKSKSWQIQNLVQSPKSITKLSMSNDSNDSDVELSKEEISRYSRHLVLGDVGMTGQKSIKNASVLVIGAGGLGSPCLMYLAAAGIGHIGIVVSLSLL